MYRNVAEDFCKIAIESSKNRHLKSSLPLAKCTGGLVDAKRAVVVLVNGREEAARVRHRDPEPLQLHPEGLAPPRSAQLGRPKRYTV